jgi:hypothetical protein
MKRRHVICLLALLIVQAFYTNSFAVVEWNIQNTIKMDLPPVDVAVSADGKLIFVLTETGEN